MYYTFWFYDRRHRHIETARIFAGSDCEAWGKADEYAYRYGYADFMMKED